MSRPSSTFQLLRDLREVKRALSKDRGLLSTVEYMPRPNAAEENFIKALAQPIDVQFRDTKLEACIESIAKQTGLAIRFDRAPLSDEGVSLEQPLSLNLKNCRCESVLHLLLAPFQLGLFFEDDVPVISTEAKIGEKLDTRIYPVSDLDQVQIIERAIDDMVEPDTWEDLSGPGSIAYVREAKCLVIRQTQAVHGNVLQLLRDLRAAKRVGQQ